MKKEICIIKALYLKSICKYLYIAATVCFSYTPTLAIIPDCCCRLYHFFHFCFRLEYFSVIFIRWNVIFWSMICLFCVHSEYFCSNVLIRKSSKWFSLNKCTSFLEINFKFDLVQLPQLIWMQEKTWTLIKDWRDFEHNFELLELWDTFFYLFSRKVVCNSQCHCRTKGGVQQSTSLSSECFF